MPLTSRLSALVLTTIYLLTPLASLAGANFHVDRLSDAHLRVTLDINGASVNRDSDRPGLSIQGEGTVAAQGLDLPAITRYVLVPEGALVEVRMGKVESSVVDFQAGTGAMSFDNKEMRQYNVGEEVNLAGYHLVPVTFYPVGLSGERLQVANRIEAEVVVSGGVGSAIPAVQSEYAARLLDGVTLNPPRRDLPGESAPAGGYLVVAHESCLPYAIPLLEWKRQSGYTVDILSYSNAELQDTNAVSNIKQDIAVRHNSHSYDYLLILGDRAGNRGQAPWIIPAPEGFSSMAGIVAPHADYAYALLDGDDDIADLGVGRIPGGSRDRMNLAVQRQLRYEKTPYVENPDWFNRAGVFAQRWGENQGVDVMYNVRWGESTLYGRGYNPILNQISAIQNDDGDTVAAHLTDWFNNQRLGVMIGRAQIRYWQHEFRGVNESAIFPYCLNVCGHGEFPAEWIFCTGDSTHLKGPVVWTTGWGQPVTKFSNGVWSSLVSGVFVHDLPVGWARTLVGLNFPLQFPNEARDYMAMNQTDLDVLGDPGLKPWIGRPLQARLELLTPLSVGSDFVSVRLTNSQTGEPIGGARLTVYQPGNLPAPGDYAHWTPAFQATQLTLADGTADVPAHGGLEAGKVYITATGSIVPAILEYDLTRAQVPLIALDWFAIADGAVARAGSTFNVFLRAINRGGAARGITAVINSDSPYVICGRVQVNFGDIAAGNTRDADRAIPITIAPSCPNGYSPPITVQFSDGVATWTSPLILDVIAPKMVVSGVPGEPFSTTQPFSIAPRLVNRGGDNLLQSSARLIPLDWSTEPTEEVVRYDTIRVQHNEAPLNGELFHLKARPGVLPGSWAKLGMVLSVAEAVVDTIEFQIQFAVPGRALIDGPDKYGYVCIDPGDGELSPAAPRYRWIEINPEMQGGEEGEFVMDSSSNGNSIAIGTPFPIRFYGRSYDSLTVCSNGFIAPGVQLDQVNYQNGPMSLAMGGAAGMIAPFWDILEFRAQAAGRGAYSWYDEENSRFIIEWSRIRHPVVESDLSFQVQILDAREYPTATGDCPIIFQYRFVENLQGDNNDVPYASVGLSSPDGRTGLGVNYNGQGTAATPLVGNNFALLFTTIPNTSYMGIIGVNALDHASGDFVRDVRLTLTPFGFPPLAVDTIQGEQPLGMGLIPLGWYELRGRAVGYSPVRQVVEITPQNQRPVTLSMLRPQFDLSQTAIRDSLNRSQQFTNMIRVMNLGTGPLDYSVRVEGNPALVEAVRHGDGALAPGTQDSIEVNINAYAVAEGDYRGAVICEDTTAQIVRQIPFELNINDRNDVPPESLIPVDWYLSEAYPNPFNGRTELKLSIPYSSRVKVAVYDLSGRPEISVLDRKMQAGVVGLSIDAAGLPAGLHIVRMEAAERTFTRKIVLVK